MFILYVIFKWSELPVGLNYPRLLCIFLLEQTVVLDTGL